MIVLVPDAPDVVTTWLERTAYAKPSAGVPPHVTVVFPFMPADGLDTEVVDELRDVFSRHAPFAFTLSDVARFPNVLYLEPRPREPFAALTHAVMERYPDFPPYGGAFDDPVPHLTVAEGTGEVLDAAEADVAPHVPIEARADEVVLLCELEPNAARWEAHARLPLGG